KRVSIDTLFFVFLFFFYLSIIASLWFSTCLKVGVPFWKRLLWCGAGIRTFISYFSSGIKNRIPCSTKFSSVISVNFSALSLIRFNDSNFLMTCCMFIFLHEKPILAPLNAEQGYC